MSKTRSQAAQAAALIRKELKKFNIKASVRSESYSMGSSVTVNIDNQSPTTSQKIKDFIEKYAYNKGMDIADNVNYAFNDSVPQASFVFVSNNFSKELREKAEKYITNRYGDAYNDDYEMNSKVNSVLYTDSLFWTSIKQRVAA